MKIRDQRQEQLRNFGELFDKYNPVLDRKADDRAATAHRLTVGRTAGSNPATGDICLNRHKGNEQSTAAFHVIKDKISHEQTKILVLIAGYPNGITVDEIAERYQKTPNQVSGRVSELKRMGKIYKSGIRKTRSGCSAAILKAFP